MTDLELATSRTWAEIDLDNLTHNYSILRNILTPSAKFLGVVKANAYGHGSIPCARKLQECGADYLAVAAIPEAAELRHNGISLPILCLGQTQPSLAPLMCELGVTQAVGDLDNGRALSEYAHSHHKTLRIHVKLDTGMSRTGFYWPDDESAKLNTARLIDELCSLPGLEPEGIFTHFAVADDDKDFTRLQLNRLLEAKRYLAKIGRTFSLTHAAASIGSLDYPEAHLDMARFGLVLYGYASTETGNANSTLGLKPVMSLKSRITAVRRLPAGTTISYGRTHTLTRDSVIAVLPAGYADGLHRVLSNRLRVKIHDTLCPNVGRICMDMTMIDVTDVPGVRAGDVATIFDGELAPEMAKNAGTIIHELVCSPSLRVPRVYVEAGKLKA